MISHSVLNHNGEKNKLTQSNPIELNLITKCKKSCNDYSIDV